MASCVISLSAAETLDPSVTLEAPVSAEVAVPLESAEAPPVALPVSPRSIEAFKIVHERNIFNANRLAARSRRPQVTNAPPPRVDSFSLVGTLLSTNGHYAFFSGTDEGFNTVLKVGEQIADHKIMAVLTDSIKLRSTDDLEIELPIQMQMKRLDGGPWQVIVGTSESSGSQRSRDRGSSSGRDLSGSVRSDPRNSGPSRRDRGAPSNGRGDSGVAPSSASAPSSGGSGGDAVSAEEILKRLMEQRAKEQN